MYDIVIRFHFVISSLFVILAFIVVIWSTIGWIKKLNYSKVFNRLSFFFLHLLYLQLITGIVLYFFLKPDPDSGSLTLEEAMNQSSMRFWAIEHVSLMIFALILSQIGRFILKESTMDRKKYRSATLYFGISLVVVLSSAAVSMFG